MYINVYKYIYINNYNIQYINNYNYSDKNKNFSRFYHKYILYHNYRILTLTRKF